MNQRSPCNLRICRNRELEDSSAGGVWGGPEAATVGFDDGAADREAHAHAVRFRREEGIKDTLENYYITNPGASGIGRAAGELMRFRINRSASIAFMGWENKKP